MRFLKAEGLGKLAGFYNNHDVRLHYPSFSNCPRPSRFSSVFPPFFLVSLRFCARERGPGFEAKRMACTAASQQAKCPAHTCNGPAAAWMSSLIAVAIALPMIRRIVSPIPIGRTPGHLSRAMRRQPQKKTVLLGPRSKSRYVWRWRLGNHIRRRTGASMQQRLNPKDLIQSFALMRSAITISN